MIHELIIPRHLKKAAMIYDMKECGLTKKEAENQNPWESFDESGGFDGPIYKYMKDNNMIVIIDDTKDVRTQIRESNAYLPEVLDVLLEFRRDTIEYEEYLEEQRKELKKTQEQNCIGCWGEDDGY